MFFPRNDDVFRSSAKLIVNWDAVCSEIFIIFKSSPTYITLLRLSLSAMQRYNGSSQCGVYEADRWKIYTSIHPTNQPSIHLWFVYGNWEREKNQERGTVFQFFLLLCECECVYVVLCCVMCIYLDVYIILQAACAFVSDSAYCQLNANENFWHSHRTKYKQSLRQMQQWLKKRTSFSVNIDQIPSD